MSTVTHPNRVCIALYNYIWTSKLTYDVWGPANDARGLGTISLRGGISRIAAGTRSGFTTATAALFESLHQRFDNKLNGDFVNTLNIFSVAVAKRRFDRR